jgi:hypothetical protein
MLTFLLRLRVRGEVGTERNALLHLVTTPVKTFAVAICDILQVRCGSFQPSFVERPRIPHRCFSGCTLAEFVDAQGPSIHIRAAPALLGLTA